MPKIEFYRRAIFSATLSSLLGLSFGACTTVYNDSQNSMQLKRMKEALKNDCQDVCQHSLAEESIDCKSATRDCVQLHTIRGAACAYIAALRSTSDVNKWANCAYNDFKLARSQLSLADSKWDEAEKVFIGLGNALQMKRDGTADSKEREQFNRELAANITQLRMTEKGDRYADYFEADAKVFDAQFTHLPHAEKCKKLKEASRLLDSAERSNPFDRNTELPNRVDSLRKGGLGPTLTSAQCPS